MPPVAAPLPGWGLDATDRRLVAHLQATLPLTERPFAVLGAALGLGEDEVLHRLHRLLAQGEVLHFGPVFADAAPDAGDTPADAALRRDLEAATRSGLPLLARPYEAVGAMVGASGQAVRDTLASMLADGSLLRIGVLTRPDEPEPAAE